MIAKRPLFFAFLALCAGIWLCDAFGVPFLFEQIYPPNHIKNFTPKDPADSCVTAIIASDPVSQKATYGRIKTTFTAKALTLERAGAGLKPDPAGNGRKVVCGLVDVASFDEEDAALEYGDYILIRGVLTRPAGFANPGVFNYRRYLARKGIYSLMTVKKGGFISVLEKDKANHFIKRVFALKHRLRVLIERYSPGTEAEVLKGILLGERAGIKDSLKDRFVKTGTVHVLVISGLHVGLLAFIFVLLLRFLRLGRYVAYPLASILLIIYAILTGANTPVVRATVMAVVILIAMASGRKADVLNCLGLSGIAILLKNPSAVFDAGFQLSFATVASIIIFTGKFEEFLKARTIRNPVFRYLARSVCVSFAAWIGIIPVIAYHFNIVSPVCIIANIPVVLLLSFVVAGGLAFLAFGMALPFFAEIFGLACGFLISVLVKIVTLFSKVPFGFFWTHRWGAFEIIAFYAVLITLGISLYNRKFSKKYVVISSLIFLNIFVWQDILRNTDDGIRTTVLDVGHGDAIVVEFPGSGCVLIDAGSTKGDMDIGEDVVGPFLRSRRIEIIDAIFLTHSDEDHAGGVPAVLNNFKVRNIFDSSSRPLKRFDKIAGFKDAEILVLNPPEKDFFGKGSNNNNSTVLKITSSGYSFLFCADIQEDAMRELLKYPSLIKSDVIKIPHHGAGWGITEEFFLETASPRVALISASLKDVSDSLLDYLSAINCKAYKTHSDGAITVRETGSGLAVETYN